VSAGRVAPLWDLILEKLSDAAPHDARAHAILAALEVQLTALDQIGARIAAAHVDAAIQQLRRDMAGL
jgi:hypothetical protein